MRRRDFAISCFVIAWSLIFHYESLRAHYLSPLLLKPRQHQAGGRWYQPQLPKLPLLFQPAGWIMFFRIDSSYGFAEVWTQQDDQPIKLDPHDIFSTKAIGYDNIHRNMLIGVLDQHRASDFCAYLQRKFPQYERFAVLYGHYPDVVKEPKRIERQVAYRCP